VLREEHTGHAGDPALRLCEPSRARIPREPPGIRPAFDRSPSIKPCLPIYLLMDETHGSTRVTVR
jgi:hypothetical protein